MRGMAVLAGGLWLAPASVLAQEAPPSATTNTTAPATVGPSELQNFSLSGSAARPGDDQQAPAPAAKPAQSPAATQRSASTSPRVGPTAQDRPLLRQSRAPKPSLVPAARTPATPQPATVPPPEGATPVPGQQPAPLPAIETQSVAPAPKFAQARPISILPWLIAALALAGGTIFLLWRRRQREALAGPEFDLFSGPQSASAHERAAVPAPVPDPVPTPAPPQKRAAGPSGIVTSRLRPSLELGVQPLRCVIEDSQVTIEFEVELFNAGTAPARAVLAEASLLNAGASQDQELAAFFASPVGAGERLDAIPPMRRISLTSRVVAPRGAIQEYELAGRKAFVPVIAFNALYEWSGGKAQTSAAYLVGRDTRSEKLGPLHLDQGARAVTTLAAHELPAMVRT